ECAEANGLIAVADIYQQWGSDLVVGPTGDIGTIDGSFTRLATAPFLGWKLPALRPGFASGVGTYTSNGTYTVPTGVSQVEVEVWGGGSGSYASTQFYASGGGAGGSYARKRVTGLVA